MPATVYICISGFATGPEIWMPIIASLRARLGDERSLASTFLPLPFYDLLGQSLPSKLLNTLEAVDKSTQIVLCGWSAGASLLLHKLAHILPLCARVVMASFSPRMLRDAGYIGYTNATFDSMRRNLIKSKPLFVHDFFRNVCRSHGDVARRDWLVRQAMQIDDSHLLGGLDFLRACDVRANLSSLINTATNADIARPRLAILQGLHDTVVPIGQLSPATAGVSDNVNNDLLVADRPKASQILSRGKNVSWSNIACGHDIIFEAKDCIVDALLGDC